MMYKLNVQMFTKEEVTGKENGKELSLFVEGKSPKGSVSFLCNDDQARELYSDLISANAKMNQKRRTTMLADQRFQNL